MNKEYLKLNLKDITPYGNNPRHNDGAVAAVKESIKQCGYVAPIIVDEDNIILAGHTRHKALKSLKRTEVEVLRISGLTEEQKRKYRLLDNKTNELAEWDFDLLGAELEGLDFDGFDFGFELPDMDEDTEIIEDEAPEVNETEPPIAKLGDVWQLGKHRLMCGDSTCITDIEKLMNGREADLVFTDPPYGIDVVKGNQVGGSGITHFGKDGGQLVPSSTYIAIKGDESTDTARLNYEIIKDISKNQIIFGGNYFSDFLPPKSCWCIWDKENTGNFADVEMAWTSFSKGAKLYHWLWNGLCRKGERNVEGTSRVHPTQKPVGLIAEILKDFAKEDEVILDCFGGSGSTLIACEQIDRLCLMMEYEPHYVDVIIKRWEQFTGEKAVLLNE